jgi:hypothetical protein
MLAIAGIYRLPIRQVMITIWSGKLLKYLAYVATKFPNLMHRLTHTNEQKF